MPGADECALSPTRSSSGDEARRRSSRRRSNVESGRVRVSVTVPDDQPAGRYRGAIRDATGAARRADGGRSLTASYEPTPQS